MGALGGEAAMVGGADWLGIETAFSRCQSPLLYNPIATFDTGLAAMTASYGWEASIMAVDTLRTASWSWTAWTWA